MMKLKIIRAKPKEIEEKVNKFFEEIGRIAGYKVKIENTQLVHVGGVDAEEAYCILYNATRIEEPPAPGAINPTPPGPKGIGQPKNRPHSTPITKP